MGKFLSIKKRRLRRRRKRRKKKRRKMSRKFYKENTNLTLNPPIVFELTKPTGFLEITDSLELRRLYQIQYGYRINDGKQYVLDFTTDRYLDTLNGTYTDAEVFALESHIKDLYDQLNNGWWLTAKNTNSNLTLSGIYSQTMKDEIQAVLDNYVTNNY